jgi:imidazolonepropionase-like amidohydrolase
LLKRAGIPFALGFSSDWDSRNLPLAAGQTVAWGLSKEQALKAITQDAAKILGVDNLGAVVPGFQANIVVSSGDILDPMSSRIELMFIDGRQVDLNNRHRQLYQKYLKR